MKTKKSFIKNKINFLIHLIVKVKKDDISALSSQLAYYLVLSFFPFMIFLITLVGFSSLDSGHVITALHAVLPESVVNLTQSIITEVFDKQYKGLLSISILLALWTAASGFRAVIKGVNKAYNFKETRSFIKRTIISMLGILALTLIIILALGILVFGGVIGQYLQKVLPFHNLIIYIWIFFRYAFIFLLMMFIFTLIYRVAPAQKLKFREVIPGAIFSTIGWSLSSISFSFYINNFRNFSRFYGSLGAVFILMTWLFFVSLIFIMGVEINCVLSEIKINKDK